MLKLLAMLIMTIDHVGAYFSQWIPYSTYELLRTIGRLAFPCFVYYLVLGYRRTRNIVKYFLRLLAFAGISQLAMNAMSSYTGRTTYTNVFFTLSISLALITGFDLFIRSSRDLMLNLRLAESTAMGDEGVKNDLYTVRFSPGGISMPAGLGMISGVALFLIAIFMTEQLDPDYDFYGLTLALAYHIALDFVEPMTKTLRVELKIKHILVFVTLTYLVTQLAFYLGARRLAFFTPMSDIQIYASLAPILFIFEPYGKRPPAWQRWAFYIYYPAHITLFMYLRYFFTLR